MVVVACGILLALVAVAFMAHTAGRGRAARVAVGFAGVEALDIAASDLGRQAWTPLAHAFTVCALAVVPLGAAALVSLAATRARGRG